MIFVQVSYNALVKYHSEDTSPVSIEDNSEIISFSLIIADLRPGTQYQFTIVAYTSVGPGSEAMATLSTLGNGNNIIVSRLAKT